MLFNSLPFLYAFLPITYLVFWRLRTRSQRYIWLAATGYVFYGFWNWKFCGLMAFSTLTSYLAGLGLLRWTDHARRRLCLIVPVAIDLLLLGFFKYADFAIDSTNSMLRLLGAGPSIGHLNVILPVGISFYTFHTITYIVDAYRGTIRPTKNLAEFACYVSLFAQLVAGPIVRFRQIEQDLDRIDHGKRAEDLERGWSFFALGLFKKLLIADSIAFFINPMLSGYATLGTMGAWLAMVGYTYQLYFDFSGYSDMAIGLGLLFGLRLPQNFNSPYRATDPSDFWKRWHISLSSVMRDYLYIPLGGNRGRRWFVYRNIMVTMLLGGLWHGAQWTFVAWGAYHGGLLIVHRLAARPWSALPATAQRAVTFLLVVVGWVFFRSTDFTMARSLLTTMFTWRPWVPPSDAVWLMALVTLAGMLAHLGPNTFQLSHRWRPATVTAIGLGFATCLALLYVGNAAPFLYFQF